MEARSFWVTVMKFLGFFTKGFWIWIGFGFTLFLLTTGIFTMFAGDQVQSLPIGEITDRAEQISFQDHNLTVTGNDAALYLECRKDIFINYIDISVKDLSIPTINARLYYADTQDFQDAPYRDFFIHEGFNEIRISVGEKKHFMLCLTGYQSLNLKLEEIVLRSAIRPLYRIPQGFIVFFLVWILLYLAAAKMGIQYQNLNQGFIILLEGMFALFLIVIILFSIGNIKYRLAVYLLVPLCVYLLAVSYPKIKVGKIKARVLIPVVLLFMTIGLCTTGSQMLSQLLTDLGTVYYSAWEIAEEGRVSTICTGQESHSWFFQASNNNYFLRYPNNLPLLAILAVFYKILSFFGLGAADLMSNYMSILLNVGFIIIAVIFGMLAVGNIYGNKGKFMYVLMAAFFIPYYIHACRFYTDTISMPFLTLALWIDTIDIKKFKLPYIKYIFIGISAGLGALIKGSIYVILIAFCMQLILKHVNYIRFAAVMIIMVAVVHSSWDFYTKNCSWIDMSHHEEWEFPILTHWPMMGLNRSVNGGYSQSDLEYLAQYPTKSERQKASLEMIQYRIASFGSLQELGEYEFSKAAATWCDGQYMQNDHISWSIEKGGLFDYLTDGRKFYGFYKIYTQVFSYCIYFFAIAGSLIRLKRPKADHSMFLRLTMLGVILFFMIWESKSRYLLNYTPVFMMAAVGGLEEIENWIKRN